MQFHRDLGSFPMEVTVQNMTSMVSVNRCRVTDDCNPEAWLSGDTMEALVMIYIYVDSV